MSEESEAFLTRWSKRKAQARVATTVEDAQAEASQPDAASGTGLDAAGTVSVAESEPDEVALEDLPAIDSIDASTDLTPWLKQKLPEAWKRAALSRVWAADPAISQFIGLSDYAWDWNVPDGVPGFGPLRATDDVVQLLAQAMGQTPRRVIAESEEAEAGMSDAPQPEASQPPEMPKEAADETFIAESLMPEPGAAEISPPSAALEDHKIVRRRRGGGALPS
jgi:Protein of unknown function (DUF3306)